jgi:hypothetical protein
MLRSEYILAREAVPVFRWDLALPFSRQKRIRFSWYIFCFPVFTEKKKGKEVNTEQEEESKENGKKQKLWILTLVSSTWF